MIVDILTVTVASLSNLITSREKVFACCEICLWIYKPPIFDFIEGLEDPVLSTPHSNVVSYWRILENTLDDLDVMLVNFGDKDRLFIAIRILGINIFAVSVFEN